MDANIKVLQECENPVFGISEDSKAEVEPFGKAKSMKDDRQKKKDVKSVEQVLKALSSLNTAEEKLAAMCKKYTEIVDENRKLQQAMKHSEKRYTAVSKEKEQLQLEYNKNVLLKSKLENLCRELQKQNKTVKEESLLKIREEEMRRKETQAKFQTTLSEISALMRQNNENNTELRDANINITNKFKTVVEQYELREQQIDKMAKQMALESQLADAKLAKANLEAQAEREKMIAENKQLLVEIAQYQVKVQEMQGTEIALRSQVNMYTDKYDEFQAALSRSNEVFGGFKGEMEKMSKKITKLEKESLSWKQRWEGSHVALLDMVAEKQKSDGQSALLGRQLAQLQKLCRTMQAERGVLIKALEDHNIPRPALPPIATESVPDVQPPPQSNTIDKVDEMALNCAQLKQSLAQLQGQLHALTTKHTGEEENVTDPKKGKSKKNKSKKNKEKRESPTIANPSAEAAQIGECLVDAEEIIETDNVDCSSVNEENLNDEASEENLNEEASEENGSSRSELNVDNRVAPVGSSNNVELITENQIIQNFIAESSLFLNVNESQADCLRESVVSCEVPPPTTDSMKLVSGEEKSCDYSPVLDSLDVDHTSIAGSENLPTSVKAVASAITDVSNVIADALCRVEKS